MPQGGKKKKRSWWSERSKFKTDADGMKGEKDAPLFKYGAQKMEGLVRQAQRAIKTACHGCTLKRGKQQQRRRFIFRQGDSTRDKTRNFFFLPFSAFACRWNYDYKVCLRVTPSDGLFSKPLFFFLVLVGWCSKQEEIKPWSLLLLLESPSTNYRFSEQSTKGEEERSSTELVQSV